VSKFRYVAIQPGRIEHKKEIGAASYLHDFLVDHQTDREGNVNYGKPFGYAWIRSRWPGRPPCLRSLKYNMATLKQLGLVSIRMMPLNQGMCVRVVGSAKWSPQPAIVTAPDPQFSLFPDLHPRGQEVAPVGCKNLPPKEVKKLREEKSVPPPTPPSETDGGSQRLRRLTKVQIEARVGAGPTTAPPSFCAVCGNTKFFHRMKIENKLRHDPRWIEHEFIEEGNAATG
jgi:hypothetical protein